AEALAAQEGLGADVDVKDVPGLSQEVETVLYRVAQEALRNVMRHARANRVSVVLRPNGDSEEVRVSDDGVGFSAGGGELGRRRGGRSAGDDAPARRRADGSTHAGDGRHRRHPADQGGAAPNTGAGPVCI